ncbi:MAG: peptidoglycan-binding protein [Calothrix sp. MO_192.B10]|nr:peptidoglycan-binding protein [Calothrix sp. MO_192.B10]
MNTEIKSSQGKPTLQLGAKIQSVRDMQIALNHQLARLDTISKFPLHTPVTGYFGEETKNAVKYLQCLAFLKIDGIVGQQTWAYLCHGVASLPQHSLGSCGRQIVVLQQLLKGEGYYTGIVDGIFGMQTETAIRKLQAQYNLNVDGTITESTWMILSRLNSHVYSCSAFVFGGC